jgi:cytochrome c-type biogenesis protein CcmH
MTVFLVVAVLLTLACVAVVTIPLLRAPDARAPVAAVCVAVAIPAAVTLLYAGVSSYPWLAIGAVAAGDGVEPPATAALREEARRSPGDPQAWTALADAYVGESRYAEARDAYREAMRADGGGSDELRLAFAETSILVDRGALGGEAGTIVEDILARDPVNPKALWYGGMAALARDDAAAARTRWSRLLELSPPPQVRQIIEQQLANLDSGPGTPTTATAAAGGQPASIPVRVTVDPRLASRIRPGAVLFLFAREPAGAGPPLAVARRNAAELPLETALSDADSMVPGRTLAGVAEVRVTARVANDGEALAAPGDVFGEATWRAGGGPLDITIDRVVE